MDQIQERMKSHINSACTSYTFVSALLLLSAIVEGQDNNIMMLRNFFEEALVNSNESLFQLQQVYFDPTSHYSPSSVCVTVIVTVDNNIAHPAPASCSQSYLNYDDSVKAAFECYDPEDTTITCKWWQFNSTYELKLPDNGRDSIQLSSLLTYPLNAAVFYTFDPSFYKIMKSCSLSTLDISERSFPIQSDSLAYESSTKVKIQINKTLENMPCRNDAIYALEMVLVWVSKYIHTR